MAEVRAGGGLITRGQYSPGVERGRELPFKQRPCWRGTLDQLLAEVSEFDPGPGADSRKEPSAHWSPITYEQALERGVKGWNPGTEAMLKDQRLMFATAQNQGQQVLADVEGQWFDVGEYLAGTPEHCFSLEMQPLKQRPLNIHVSASYLADVDAADIQRRGAAIAEIIDRLREEGPVTVYFWHCTDIHASIVEMNTDRGYSRNVVAFCAADSAFPRRIGFAMLEKMVGKSSAAGRGYGRTVGVDASIVEDANNIVICHVRDNDAFLHGWNSTEKAKAKVGEIIARIKALAAKVNE